MIFVDPQILDFSQKRFENLIIRHDIVEAHKGNRVLNARVMCVESDDVLDSHRFEFLKRYRAVKRFAGRAFVLSSAVEDGHDDVYTGGFAADCGNYAFKILKVIVRRHRNASAEHIVFATVIADIRHDEKIVSSDRFGKSAFSVTRCETRTFRGDQKRSFRVGLVLDAGICLVIPFHKIIVDLVAEFDGSRRGNYPYRKFVVLQFQHCCGF